MMTDTTMTTMKVMRFFFSCLFLFCCSTLENKIKIIGNDLKIDAHRAITINLKSFFVQCLVKKKEDFILMLSNWNCRCCTFRYIELDRFLSIYVEEIFVFLFLLWLCSVIWYHLAVRFWIEQSSLLKDCLVD